MVARYIFAHKDAVAANGKVDKAGTHDATFMLCNRDLGDGEIDFPRLHRVLRRVKFKGWITIGHHYTPAGTKRGWWRPAFDGSAISAYTESESEHM